MLKKFSITALLIFGLVVVNAFADNHGEMKDKNTRKAETMTSQMAAGSAEHVSLEGQIVCMSCDLKKTEGAQAACKVYGHHYALKTAEGKYIGFLENNHSEDLLQLDKYHNKNLEVTGLFYPDANLMAVETFQVGDKTMSWCSHCSKMDACGANK